MEYQEFRRRKLDKYFTNAGLYLIGPNVVKTTAMTMRSGSKGAMNLATDTPIYKLGLAGSGHGISGRLGSYATALPNGFKIYCIVEKQPKFVQRDEKKIHTWLKDCGLLYNRFGDVGDTVSRTEWGGASLVEFRDKILLEHNSSTSHAMPMYWFSKDDARVLSKQSGKAKSTSLNTRISSGEIQIKPKKKAPDRAYTR